MAVKKPGNTRNGTVYRSRVFVNVQVPPELREELHRYKPHGQKLYSFVEDVIKFWIDNHTPDDLKKNSNG